MKKTLYLLIALLLASCGSQQTASVSSGGPKGVTSATVSLQTVLAQVDTGRYKPSEVIVKFKSGVSSSTISSVNTSLGATLIKNLSGGPNLLQVKIPASLSVKDAVTAYMSNANVEYAEPNYLYSIKSTSANDQYFNPQQWALNNTGTFAHGLAGADVKAPQTWDLLTGNVNMVIAVLDTGIDYTHPDLQGNIWTNPLENPNNAIDDDNDGKVDDWRGWNFVWVDKNGNGRCDRHPEDPVLDENCHDPLDDNGHGTHVAGIIGAVGNNGTGVTGLMWHVQVMPLKVCDATGSCPLDAINDAIHYAISKNVKIINMSLGSYVYSESMKNAIADANTAGALVMAAAGNDQNNNDVGQHFPSGYNLPNIISVASTDQQDLRSDFSNFGLWSVHVAAPGTYILSTVPIFGTDPSFGSLCTGALSAGYDFCSGTSMATPYVSAEAGLLMTMYPHFTAGQIRATILRYVDVLPMLSSQIMTGGRINVYKAVSSLLTPTNLAAKADSSAQVTLSWADNATGEDGYYVERKTAGGQFVQVAALAANSTGYTDAGLAPSTAYTYRVRAFNTIPAQSLFSNESSVTTPASGSDSGSGGGGGGCSIGGRQNAATSFADAMVMLMPLAAFFGVRAIRRRK